MESVYPKSKGSSISSPQLTSRRHDPYFGRTLEKDTSSIQNHDQEHDLDTNSGEDEQLWRPQAIRMKKLWQLAREELAQSQLSLQDMKDRVHDLGSHQRYLESKEREVVSLSQRNATLLRERERLEAIVAPLEKGKVQLDRENQKLVEQVKELSAQVSAQVSQQRARDQTHAREHEEMLTLKSQLAVKTSRVEQLETDLRTSGVTTEELELELETKVRWAKTQEQASQEREHEQEMAHLTLRQKHVNLDIEHQTLLSRFEKQHEALARAEAQVDRHEYLETQVRHYQRDCQRLLGLLVQTKEYQTFEYFQHQSLEDVEGKKKRASREGEEGEVNKNPLASGYSYFNPVETLVFHQDKTAIRHWGETVNDLRQRHPPTRPIFSDSGPQEEDDEEASFDAMLQKNARLPSLPGSKGEKNHWIPHDILLLCHKPPYRNYLRVHEHPLFYGLVYEMNVIWRKIEHFQYQKIHARYQKEIVALRRQVQNQRPYQHVVQQAEVVRLKQQILDQSKMKYQQHQRRKGSSLHQRSLEKNSRRHQHQHRTSSTAHFDQEQQQMNDLMTEWIEQEEMQNEFRKRETLIDSDY